MSLPVMFSLTCMMSVAGLSLWAPLKRRPQKPETLMADARVLFLNPHSSSYYSLDQDAFQLRQVEASSLWLLPINTNTTFT